MRVTQQDIARIANVSQATVSRVVQGDDKVEPSIRIRVQAAMREHAYAPDVRARQLRSKRTGLIGLVLQRPPGGLAADPFFASLTADILDALVDTEYHLCLDLVTGEDRQSAVYEEMLRSRRVDGLILVESQASDPRLQWLAQNRFPFVLIGNPIDADEVHSVDNDNVAAAEIATAHLLEKGYRNPAFLAARDGITVSDDRIAGYRRAMGDRPLRVAHADFGAEAAFAVTRDLFARYPDVDSVVVLDDYMAFGTVGALRQAGKRIGPDVGLVSFNDTHLCDMVEGGLTSVSLNMPLLVDSACDRLLSIVEKKKVDGPLRQIVPCELKARRSSFGRSA